jgi:transcriptional regulator of acetoin/glycerol metabolism
MNRHTPLPFDAVALPATEDQPRHDTPTRTGPPLPGLVLVWCGGRPCLRTLPLEASGAIELGRHTPQLTEDGLVSRRHARIALVGGLWEVTDLDSRNGTFVDGVRAPGRFVGERLRVIRLGDSLIFPSRDVRPYRGAAIELRGDLVMGPILGAAWTRIAAAARTGETLYVTGETGVGKELGARAFHEHGPRPKGPFVAINCAAIPQGVAERLLFGSRRGAYSGAVDAEGYLQAADGGTLLLDEIGELDPAVQAKLLRAIETREVLPLGASQPRIVDVRFVVATHRDLEAEVRANRFRDDLYYRLARPHVAIPSLAERREEIPWLVERALQRREPALPAHTSLMEAALLRDWPGNVRELLAEVRAAVAEAAIARATQVDVTHLHARTHPSAPSMVIPQRRRHSSAPEASVLEEALRLSAGNVTEAARRLGVHRTQLRRWIRYLALDVRAYSQPRS